MSTPTTSWWSTPSLAAGPDGLALDGHPLVTMAREHGTPTYVYSRAHAVRRLGELRGALADTGLDHRAYYALKANRHPPLVGALVEAGAGIDACSPREVAYARELGVPADAISFNAGMLSERDLDRVVAAGCHVTLDARSALRRYGARVPRGTRVGLRLDPGVEAGYGHDPKVVYGNAKFGFLHADLDAAVAAATDAGLVVDTLHTHCGWGLQADDLAGVDLAFARLAAAAGRVPSVRTVNVGGGLGARQREADAPLPLDAWAGLLRRHFGPLGVTVACEPGTFLVAHAGVLLCEVTQVERKGDVLWAGLDAGHNVNVYAAHYGIPLEIVPVARPDAPRDTPTHVAGNLNEAGDVFARDRMLPRLHEGDIVALLPAGAYGATMASDHCLRGWPAEVTV
ncbi:MAG: diaminopimelate decarboxylase [Myxococcota bacterium]